MGPPKNARHPPFLKTLRPTHRPAPAQSPPWCKSRSSSQLFSFFFGWKDNRMCGCRNRQEIILTSGNCSFVCLLFWLFFSFGWKATQQKHRHFFQATENKVVFRFGKTGRCSCANAFKLGCPFPCYSRRVQCCVLFCTNLGSAKTTYEDKS